MAEFDKYNTNEQDRCRQIMSEERASTMQRIANLECSELMRDDIICILLLWQAAVNKFVETANRTIDGIVVPSALRLMLDEVTQIWDRMKAEGLTRDPDHQH